MAIDNVEVDRHHIVGRVVYSVGSVGCRSLLKDVVGRKIVGRMRLDGGMS